MADPTLHALKSALKPGKRVLGLDVGSKTVGVALSDVMAALATPMETVKRTKFTQDAGKLIAIIRAHDVGGVVLGLPVEMDGSEGPRCQSTRQFAANLERALAGAGLDPLPMAFWDERLSTVAVQRVLIGEADLSRKRRAQVVDRAAAAWILQGALDALARM